MFSMEIKEVGKDYNLSNVSDLAEEVEIRLDH